MSQKDLPFPLLLVFRVIFKNQFNAFSLWGSDLARERRVPEQGSAGLGLYNVNSQGEYRVPTKKAEKYPPRFSSVNDMT